MEKIQFKEGAKDLSEALSIDEERIIELDAHIKKLLIRLKDDEGSDGTINSGEIFNQYVAAAENEKELAYLAYRCGKMIQRFETIHERVFGEGYSNKVVELAGKLFKDMKNKQKV